MPNSDRVKGLSGALAGASVPAAIRCIARAANRWQGGAQLMRSRACLGPATPLTTPRASRQQEMSSSESSRVGPVAVNSSRHSISHALSLPPAFAAIAGLVLSLALGTQAYAYNNYDNPPCKWPNGSSVTVNYRWGSSINISGYWANGFRLGSDSWNNGGTKVRLYYNSSSAAYADVYYAADGKAGKTEIVCRIFTIGEMAEFHALGNTMTLPDTYANYDEIKRTGIHEFGHGLGLGHSYDTNAVMYYANWAMTPNGDDIAGLNALYP